MKAQSGEVKRVGKAKAKIAISLSAALRAFQSKLKIERKKKGGGGGSSSNLNEKLLFTFQCLRKRQRNWDMTTVKLSYSVYLFI